MIFLSLPFEAEYNALVLSRAHHAGRPDGHPERARSSHTENIHVPRRGINAFLSPCARSRGAGRAFAASDTGRSRADLLIMAYVTSVSPWPEGRRTSPALPPWHSGALHSSHPLHW